jgi:hypothetical protein
MAWLFVLVLVVVLMVGAIPALRDWLKQWLQDLAAGLRAMGLEALARLAEWVNGILNSLFMGLFARRDGGTDETGTPWVDIPEELRGVCDSRGGVAQWIRDPDTGQIVAAVCNLRAP